MYGSQATGLAKKDSDIDLAILFGDKPKANVFFQEGSFMENLTSLLSCSVEVQDLNACDAAFVYRVLSEGKLLYQTEEFDPSEFQTRAVSNYFDLKPLYDEYYFLLSERARRGLIGRIGV